MLQSAIGTWAREALFAALKTAGVPGGPINDLNAALTDPQLAAREMVVAPEGDKGLRTPLVFSRSTLKIEKGVPALGETPLRAAKWSER